VHHLGIGWIVRVREIQFNDVHPGTVIHRATRVVIEFYCLDTVRSADSIPWAMALTSALSTWLRQDWKSLPLVHMMLGKFL
jgi:hypothetical protein